MAQAPQSFDLSSLLGFTQLSPDVNLGLANLPQKEWEAPMPYSPEGWNVSKLMAPMPKTEDAPATETTKKGEKKASTGFTPEQTMALQKMLTVEPLRPVAGHGSGGAAGAGRGQLGQMQQIQAGGIATAPRASLGQILYGGRKF